MQSNIRLFSNQSRPVFNRLWLVALLGILLCVLLSPGWGLDVDGWSSGFSHPLLGYDHLLTMLAVGVWAAQMRGHAIWQLPLTFVSVMSVGGLAGAAGVQMPVVEGIILLSCAVFAVLITRRIRFSAKINVLLVAFFAFFHGYAHGQEISTSASLLSYTAGFMLATLLLHGAGIVIARLVLLAVTGLLAILLSVPAQATLSQRTEAIAAAAMATYKSQVGSSAYAYASPLTLTSATEREGPQCCQPPRYPGLSAMNGLAKGLTWRWPQDLVVVLLGFRAYFPVINYTPGLSLLSNGVGLASPPSLIAIVLILSVLASSVFSPFQTLSSEFLFPSGFLTHACVRRWLARLSFTPLFIFHTVLPCRLSCVRRMAIVFGVSFCCSGDKF